MSSKSKSIIIVYFSVHIVSLNIINLRRMAFTPFEHRSIYPRSEVSQIMEARNTSKFNVLFFGTRSKGLLGGSDVLLLLWGAMYLVQLSSIIGLNHCEVKS